ncbi:hypothetical protein LOK49_LG15G01252 [Camellia lanceoleosa]|uniref:Uncharacterized protein n=1 Tax=Camellia lanceoleosa TaxID=1840588 RepID=A0ACC0F439_9ERIC|nr:hypothetical protein LOK49_LG15G01252 [Camellia lanceoleosa]
MELDASFPMMSKELQALVGVLRINIQDGVMTGLRVQQRVKNLALRISFRSLLLEDLDQVIKIQEVQEQRQ